MISISVLRGSPENGSLVPFVRFTVNVMMLIGSNEPSGSGGR
jgi:hypothetical protein